MSKRTKTKNRTTKTTTTGKTNTGSNFTKPPTYVISFDPGKTHFAYAIYKRNSLIAHGTIENTLKDLKEGFLYNKQRIAFLKEIKRKFKKYLDEPCLIAIERFVARGRSMGNVSECIGMMLGMMSWLFRKHYVTLIMASSWKNHFNKKEIMPENKNIVIHELDAMCIGAYAMWKRGLISELRLDKMVSKFNKLRK